MEPRPAPVPSPDSPTHEHDRRGRWLNAATLAALGVAAAVALYMLLAPPGAPATSTTQSLHGRLGPGQPAPAFSLKTPDGRTIGLSSFSGHPLLINAWATWCVPCRKEMPAIQNAYDHEKGNGFDVLAVNMMETPDAVKSFARTYRLTMPMAIDDGSFSQRYGVAVLPTSFYIDARGVVRAIHVGAMDEQTILRLAASITQG